MVGVNGRGLCFRRSGASFIYFGFGVSSVTQNRNSSHEYSENQLGSYEVLNIV